MGKFDWILEQISKKMYCAAKIIEILMYYSSDIMY